MVNATMEESLLTGIDNGTTNDPLQLDNPNLPLHMAVAAFTAIAWYNVVELNLAVYMTFRRKSGLYFWSVVACIWGIAVHSAAFILKLYGVITVYQVTVTVITVGWYAMVTGQALVLYSRLHLIVYEPRVIRAVLAMIVFNAVCMHVPTTILTYGSNSPQWRHYIAGFRVMEKLQMTMFSVQELAISAIYIWATLQFLRPVYRRHVRSVMLQLLWINVAIIAMDLAMLTMEYLGKYFLEAVMKGAVYSVKLKLEFAVLNQLMQLATSSRRRPAVRPGDSQDARRTSRPGIRGWIRRLAPQPAPDADIPHDDLDSCFISPSFFQGTATPPSHPQQQGFPDSSAQGVSVAATLSPGASPPGGGGRPLDDGDATRLDLDKPSFRHIEEDPVPRSASPHDTRTTLTLNSSPTNPSPPEKEPPVDGDGPGPSPSSQPWHARPTDTEPRMPSSNRPSVSNIRSKDDDDESRTSSEVGLHL